MSDLWNKVYPKMFYMIVQKRLCVLVVTYIYIHVHVLEHRKFQFVYKTRWKLLSKYTRANITYN